MACCVVAYLLNLHLPYQLLVLELGFGAFTFLLHRLMLRGWVQTASFGLLAYAFIAIGITFAVGILFYLFGAKTRATMVQDPELNLQGTSGD